MASRPGGVGEALPAVVEVPADEMASAAPGVDEVPLSRRESTPDGLGGATGGRTPRGTSRPPSRRAHLPVVPSGAHAR